MRVPSCGSRGRQKTPAMAGVGESAFDWVRRAPLGRPFCLAEAATETPHREPFANHHESAESGSPSPVAQVRIASSTTNTRHP